MNEKTLVLVRKTNVLRIYDGYEVSRDREYTVIFNVTHIKNYLSCWYDLYNKKTLVGFVSNVVEVKEKW